MPGFELLGKEEKKEILKLFNFKGIPKKNIFSNSSKVKMFEENFAKFVGSKYSIMVSSGTAAIKTALIAAGVKHGDEVITQCFNFIAVVEAIIDIGAKPIITEINETLNMCPEDLKRKITKKTKVIIPVHMLGVSAEIDKIKKIATKNNLIVLDDNCEALGAKWKNNMLGNQFDMCCWSFDGGKTITTGEGGMITTNSKKFYELCKEYKDHGHQNNSKLPRGRDTHRIPGFNFRSTELNASIGIAQLKKIDKILKKNSQYYSMYEKMLKNLDQIQLRKIPNKSLPLGDCIIFSFPKIEQNKKFVKLLKSNNLPTKNLPDAIEWHFSIYWDHIFKLFNIKKNKLKNMFKKSQKILFRSVAIPIYVTDSKKKVQKKINIISKLIHESL